MMPDTELVEQLALHLDVQTEMGKQFLGQMIKNARLFESKQRNYGSSNYAEFGVLGAIMRIREKSARLKTMAFDKAQAVPAEIQDESIGDSLDDIANIAVIGRLCQEGKWK